MSNVTQAEQVWIEAYQLAEQSRRERGFKPRPLNGLIRLDGKTKRRSFTGNKRYKITFWASAALYTDIMRSKIADRHLGSLTKYIERVIEQTVPMVTPRPITRLQAKAEKAKKLMEATKLKNGNHSKQAAV